MLKVRLIPTMLYRDGMICKGKQFQSWRSVGSPMDAMRVYNLRCVDEIVFLAIRGGPPAAIVKRLSKDCFIPLSVGGGVRTLDHFSQLLNAGADKVVVNTGAVERPELITEAAKKYGSQCVTVAVDYRGDQVYTNAGKGYTGLEVAEWCRRVEDLGAGEIILTSIAHEGMMQGYDLHTLERVRVNIPVVASGGAGCADDCCWALEAGADAVAVGALFHFTQTTPLDIKEYMAHKGYPMRFVS
jgi:cyclase